jgi:endonuclease/exonuclease/phosphatase family metal-dependent hydrolase
MAAAATNDPGLALGYPYRALYPDSSVLGVGLLSRYPIVEAAQMRLNCIADRATCTAPPAMRAVVQPPGGEPTVVFVVHPLPGIFQTILHVPTGIDTQQRDEGLAQIRAAVDDDLAAGRRVIVLGDINTTDREPGYAVVATGLNDARVQAGSWPGLTWRPDALRGLPFGLLRIDYVFTSMTPLSYGVRCTQLSDHCIISATLGAAAP